MINAERERETETKTDRQTDRERERESERQTDRQTDGESEFVLQNTYKLWQQTSWHTSRQFSPMNKRVHEVLL